MSLEDKTLWFLVFTSIVAIALCLSLLVALVVSYQSCTQFGHRIGYSTLYIPLSSCYIHINDRWFPRDNFWEWIWYLPEAGE